MSYCIAMEIQNVIVSSLLESPKILNEKLLWKTDKERIFYAYSSTKSFQREEKKKGGGMQRL